MWSDVLSLRRAEKEWMAGRLPVKSVRVSASSLACFCHKLLLAQTWSAHPLLALHSCRPSCNLQHQAPDHSRNKAVVKVRARRGCVFVSFSSSPWESSSVVTSVASQQSPSHASTPGKGFGLYNLELNSFLQKTLGERAAPSASGNAAFSWIHCKI